MSVFGLTFSSKWNTSISSVGVTLLSVIGDCLLIRFSLRLSSLTTFGCSTTSSFFSNPVLKYCLANAINLSFSSNGVLVKPSLPPYIFLLRSSLIRLPSKPNDCLGKEPAIAYTSRLTLVGLDLKAWIGPPAPSIRFSYSLVKTVLIILLRSPSLNDVTG